MNIAIIGAGNGGQAMAAHFAMLGHSINLYNRSITKLGLIVTSEEIWLNDKIKGVGKLNLISDDLQKVVKGCELIMVTTTADAHREIAKNIAPHVEENQMIVLNPGRTLGALEFSKILRGKTSKRVYIAEAQSLLYACRADTAGNVRVIGVKSKVLLAAYPNTDTDEVLQKVNSVYPCFIKAKDVLHTSLENIGAIIHPAVIILNAAAIERGDLFYFYNQMTPSVATVLEKLDKERLQIGLAYNHNLLSVFKWISFAYNNVKSSPSDTLLQSIRANPAYYKILAPNTLRSRLMLEDIPTGILPYIELAKLANVEVPLMKSILTMSESLLDEDFTEHGRTLANMGLKNIDFNSFKKGIEDGTIC